MSHKKTIAVFGVIAAAALILSGCAGSSGGAAEPSASAQGALDYCDGVTGGSITWYTSADADTASKLGAKFTDRCGVAVDVQSAPTVTLWQRFEQETASGLHAADVISISDPGLAAKAGDGKLVAKLDPDLLGRFEAPYADPKGYWFASRVYTLSISYNTDAISADEVPTSYADLLDPKWKGKVALLDPAQNSTGRIADTAMVNSPDIGIDWFTAMGKQEPGIFAQSGQLGNALVTGEYPIGITQDDVTWSQIAQGAPLKIVVPEEGSGQTFNQNMLAAQPANPENALGFIRFLASEDGQDLSAQLTFNYPALAGIAAYPEGRPALADVKRLPWDGAKVVSQADQIVADVSDALGTTR